MPPKGYIFVEWAGEEYGYSLVAEQDVTLLSRSLAVGDTVKRSLDDSMIGTVTSTSGSYILEPIIRLEGPPGSSHISFDFKKGSSACNSSCHPTLPQPTSHVRAQELLYRIPGEELKRAQDFEDGDHVIYQDWLGVLEDSDVDVAVLLENNSIVMVENPWELELVVPDFDKPLVSFPEIDGIKRPDVLASRYNGMTSMPPHSLARGQFVITNHRNLRCGRWLLGAYQTDCKPQGHILDVRTRRADVQWLCPNAFAPRTHGENPPPASVRPYENLNSFRFPRDLRRNKALTIFDRGRQPVRRLDEKSTVGLTQGFRIGDHVRFRDQRGAAVKYRRSDGHGHGHGEFNLIPKERTFDFDLNEFKVFGSDQEVTILWQDQSTTREDSVNLKSISFPEAELCPGDIITLKQGIQQIALGHPDHTAVEFNEMLYFQGNFKLRPQHVGVVQSVDSKERLARVRWFLNPKVELLEQGNVLRAGSKLGHISDIIEEVSLYEIMSHPALVRKRRDLVIIPPEKPSSTEVESIKRDTCRCPVGPSLLSYLRVLRLGSRYHHLRNTAKSFIETEGPLEHEPPSVTENTRPLDWIGHIVDLGSDGLLTVRLGALAQCRDVKIPFERILMVIDEDSELDDGSTTFSDEDPWGEYGSGEDEYESAIDEEVEYEGGERLDNDSGDEMWMTDEDTPMSTASPPEAKQDQDIDMLDLSEPEHTAKGSTSAFGDSPQASTKVDLLKKRVTSTAPPLLAGRPALSEFVANFDTPPPSFLILESSPPSDQFGSVDNPFAFSAAFLRRVNREHRILSTTLPSAQVYVRTYESRLDLLRCLIIGPADTPYEYAPFVVDLQLGPNFPAEPPTAHFHSWTGGLGRINPNLYEEGKICLSLLGTWPAKSPGESWSENASILQILVSLSGLVLVKQPFYNEAGFEAFGQDQVYTLESQQYSEKAFVMARGFVKHGLTSPVKGLEDVLAYLYLPIVPFTTPTPPPSSSSSSSQIQDQHRGLLEKVIARSKALIAHSSPAPAGEALVDGAGENFNDTKVFLKPLSQGAMVMLRRHVNSLEELLGALTRV